jgi:hypothetical protein
MRRETNNFLTKREFNNHPGKRKPLDLHLVLGTDNSGDELANININVELKSEKVIVGRSRLVLFVSNAS